MSGGEIAVFTPEVARDPYPVYRLLRERHPVYLEPQLRTYLVTRWDDVCAVLKDFKSFTSTKGVTPEQDAYVKPGTLPPELEMIRRFPMLTDDPPKHNRLKRIVNQAFTLRRIEELRPWMRSLVDGFLDAIPPGKSLDAVAALAGPLPMTVIAHMLGIPREEGDEFRAWSEALFIDSGDPAVAGAAAVKMAGRFAELIVERRQA
ncbi:MAG: cytochrome P450, partial [Candidatus Binatia bacterium]